MALCASRYFVFLLIVGAVSLYLAAGAQDPSSPVSDGPYLQNVTDRTASVVWHSESECLGAVGARLPGGEVEFRDDSAGITHVVALKGLPPESEVPYTISCGTRTPLAEGVFRTAPEPRGVFTGRFAVIGDSGMGNDTQRALGRLVEALNPRFVLHTGDIVYMDGDREDYPARFFEPFQYFLPRIPLYPSLGNHDTHRPQGYQSVFYPPSAESGSGTKAYYSFDYGDVHVIALNTNEAFEPGSRQYRWLLRDLAALRSRNRWRIVFFHHPPFTAGLHMSDRAVRKHLVPVFEKYQVDLVFNGHNHAYERSKPLNLSNSGRHRVLYIVSGGGGADLYRKKRPEPLMSKYAGEHHIVVGSVSARGLELRALRPDGSLIDRHRLARSGHIRSEPNQGGGQS